ncbi:MAG: hypothetical protein E7218_03160 [Anaerofustis stercorihominis]|nr:hypothetical protein [Anaerofustis stercorihominis]
MSEENNRDNLENEVVEIEETEEECVISDEFAEENSSEETIPSEVIPEEDDSEEEILAGNDPLAEETEGPDSLTEDNIEETPSVVDTPQTQTDEMPENKKKGIAGKIFKGIGVILLLVFLVAVGFIGYKVWAYLQIYVYANVNPVPSTFSNETISLSIDSAELIDEIAGFELDEEYVYVGIKYTITNLSQEAVQWKAFPYLSVNEYVTSEDEKKPGYVLVEDTAQAYELNGLRNYGIHQEVDFRNAIDDLAVGEVRTSADIFKILKTDYQQKGYFLTTDLFKEIVDLPQLESEDIITDDSTVTE